MARMNATGTHLWLEAMATDLTTKAKILTAIGATAKRIVRVGNFKNPEQTRDTTEKEYLGDPVDVAIGTIKFGDSTVMSVFDPLDTEGQDELRASFADAMERKLIVANTDGSYFVYPIYVTSDGGEDYTIGEKVAIEFKIKQSGERALVTA